MLKFCYNRALRKPKPKTRFVVIHVGVADPPRVDGFTVLKEMGVMMPRRGPGTPDEQLDEHFSAAQVAQKLNLSEDTVRRLFEDEPDVFLLRDQHPRGKRRRVALRIPRSVFERVMKKHRNS